MITKSYIRDNKTGFLVFIVLFSLSFSLIFGQFAAWDWWCNDTCYWRELSLISGDEPHYLALSSTIIKHNSINLSDFFLDPDPDPNLTFPEEYTGNDGNCEKWHGHIAEDGNCYPNHGIGLSFLLVPGYFLGGLFGAMMTMTLVFALTGIVMFKLSSKFITEKNSFVLVIFLSFGTLLFSFSGDMYSEMPVGLLLITAIYLFFFKRNNLFFNLVIGSILGSLIFFKLNFVIFPMVLLPLFSLFLIQKKNYKGVLALTGVCALIISSFMYYEIATEPVSGKYTSGAHLSSIERTADKSLEESLTKTGKGLTNLFFGRVSGMFVFSPILLLSLFGSKFFWSENRKIFLTTLLTFSSFILIMALVAPGDQWWAMPNRHLIPLYPLVGISLAFLIQRFSKNFLFQIILFGTAFIGLNFNLLFGRVAVGHNDWAQKNDIINHVYHGMESLFPYSVRNLGNLWENTSSFFWAYLLIIVGLFFIFTIYPHNRKIKNNNLAD